MAEGTGVRVRYRSMNEQESFLPISSLVILPPIGVGKLTMSLEVSNRVYVNEGVCAAHMKSRGRFAQGSL